MSKKVSVNQFNKVRKHGRLSISTVNHLTDIYNTMNALEFDCENNFTQHRTANERTLGQLFISLEEERFQDYINNHKDLKNYYNAQKERFQHLKQVSYEQC